jgi:hypothetical protein
MLAGPTGRHIHVTHERTHRFQTSALCWSRRGRSDDTLAEPRATQCHCLLKQAVKTSRLELENVTQVMSSDA